jgi:hypothetical protein
MVAGAFVLRSDADIWQAVQPVASNPGLSIRFENYPKLVITVDDGIDAISRAEALLALRSLVRRHYCLLKYGTTRLNQLTKADRAEVTLLVDETDRTRLIVDFSAALNACAKVIDQQRYAADYPDLGHSCASLPMGLCRSCRTGRWWKDPPPEPQSKRRSNAQTADNKCRFPPARNPWRPAPQAG